MHVVVGYIAESLSTFVHSFVHSSRSSPSWSRTARWRQTNRSSVINVIDKEAQLSLTKCPMLCTGEARFVREQSNNGKLIGNYTIALSNGTIVDPLRPSL